MVTITPEMHTAIRKSGSVAAAQYWARKSGNLRLANCLSRLVLQCPDGLEEVQSGCRLDDANKIRYIWTDLGHLVRSRDGVTVNVMTEVAWPLEVVKCPTKL